MTQHNASAVFVGGESLLTECASQWLKAGHSIALISSDQPAIRDWAERNGVGYAHPDDLDTATESLRFDYLFSVINFRILPEHVLDRPAIAAINFHDGPLPHYTGLNVTTWALINGETEHAICWHQMVPEVDAGDVFVREDIPIDPQETSFTLNLKCFRAGLHGFGRLVADISSGIALTSEPITGDTIRYLSSQRPAGACIIDFAEPAADIQRLSRALEFGSAPNPFGVLKLTHENVWIGVGHVRVVDTLSGAPGRIAQADASEMLIAAADQSVALSGFVTADGEDVTATQALSLLGLGVGDTIRGPDAGERAALAAQMEAASRHESFWLQRLRNLTPLSLPVEAATQEVPGRGTIELTVAGFVGAHSETELVKAWIIFLARLCGQEVFDICIRSVAQPVPGGLAEHLFQTAPPASIAVDLGQSYDDATRRLDEQLAAARSLQPFPADLPGRSHLPFADLRETCRHAIATHGSDIPQAELCFIVDDEPGRCELSYDRSRIADASVRMLAECFECFVATLDRDTPIRQSGLVSDAQTGRLLDWSGPPMSEYAADAYVHDLILERCVRAPQDCAVQFKDQILTYGELEERSRALAARIRRSGICASIVAVHLERGIDLVVAILAVLRSGNAYLPMDPMFPDDRLRFMLADSEAPIVITSGREDTHLDVSGPEFIEVEECLRTAAPSADHVPDESRSDLAYVMYTSGSTGEPKAVMVPHQCVVNFLSSMCDEPGIDQRDRLLAVTTTSFDISVLEIFGPLVAGGRIVLADDVTTADGARLSALLEDCDATVMQATPATWRMLMQSGWRGKRDLRVLCGGEALPADLAAQLLDRAAEVWNMYGPTETTVWSACKRLDHADPPITIGTAVANTRLYVLNEELLMQPPGVAGELCIGGDGVTAGYFKRPGLTDDRYHPDPYSSARGARLYRTGDIARWLPNGEIELLGRRDTQVKLRGYRIELGEIEFHLNGHPGIAESSVNVWTPDSGDPVLVAHLVDSGGSVPSSVALRKYLRQKLPDYMVPRYFVPIREFPRTANRKLDRRALPPPAADAEHAEVVPLVTEVENEIARIWRELLQTENIGRDANFFTYGGQSLLAVKAVNRMTELFGAEIQLKWLVNENLQTIAEHCEAAADASRPATSSGFGRLFRHMTGRMN